MGFWSKLKTGLSVAGLGVKITVTKSDDKVVAIAGAVATAAEQIKDLVIAGSKPVEPVIFCPNCGAKWTRTAKFCSACGTKL